MNFRRITTLLLCLTVALALSQSAAFAQSALTNGGNHSGAIGTTGGDFDAWTFSAVAGDAITLSIGEVFVGAVDPGFNPWITLVAPDTTTTWAADGELAAEIDTRAPQTGTYRVYVAHSFDLTGSNATGVGEYVLTLARSSGTIVVSAGDEGGPMTNGANHAGTIDRGDLDQWSFTATQDDALTVRIGEVLAGGADPGFNPWIRLRGPDGATLGSFQGALVSEIDVRAPLTGTYTVVVASFTVPTGTGAYLLTLAQAPGTFVVPADDEGGAMINGANHPGKIHRGDLDQWIFTAVQGDAITLSVGQIAGAEVAGFSPWVRLRAPDGATLGPFLGTLIAPSQISVTAPLTGTYTAIITSSTVPAGIGEYLLTLAKTPGEFVVPPTDEGGPMTYGVDHPGVIHRGDLDQWTFSAVLGRPISVNTAEVVTGGANPGFNPWIRLWGPDGTILGSAQGPLGARITVTAPLTGTYTVVVASFTAQSASGSYVVRVSEATPPTTVNDAYVTHVNTPLVIPAIGVLANDNANGASPLTAALATTSAHGTVTLDANGGFTYAPSPSFVGSTTFTYQAVNSVGVGNTATVTITVNPALPPTAVDDAFTLPIDFPFMVAAPGVLANDNANGGGPLSATLVASVSHGTLTLNGDGSFLYSPEPGFSGPDSSTYFAANTSGSSSIATVSITVSGTSTPQLTSGLRASSIVGNVVTFRWEPPRGGLVPTEYVVEGGLNPGQVLASISTGSASPIFTITAPTGAFYVRIHAIAGGSRSEPSNEIRIFVNLPVPPSAPANLLGVVDGSSVGLAWRNTFAGGAPRSVVLDVTGTVVGSILLGPTETATFAGVPPGTYTLQMRAVNPAGSSEASNPITLTFPESCSGSPLPPANFLAYKSGGAVHVVWDPASTGPAPTSYVLNVSGRFDVVIPTNRRSLSGVVPPGTYNLSVVTTNACGTSAATPTQVITVP